MRRFGSQRPGRRGAAAAAAAAASAALLLVLVSCGGGEDSGSAATWNRGDEAGSETRAVEAMEVSLGRFVDRIEISGLIAGSSEANVVSETSGIIREAPFDLGQSVERGQVLVRFDDTVERLSMEEARRQAETADLELAAAERLAESGNVSQADLARARSAAAGAQARYERARKVFEDQTIRAPITGAIATKDASVTSGNYLNRGIVVARVVDTERFRLAGAVGEREVRYLRSGLPAEIEIAACPEAEADAQVTAVAAGSDPLTGSFPVVVEWENTCGEAVRSGMTARAWMEPAGAEEALVIPAAALLQRAGDSVVFIAEEGRALQQTVEIGRREGNTAEVLSGLAPGDLVITSGLSGLEDESPVEVTVRGRTGDAP